MTSPPAPAGRGERLERTAAPPHPVELLRTLIRFDTSNPPGREGECIGYLARVLSEAGLEPLVLAAEPDRPNLVVRLPGRGAAPPLLLQGHVDVVPAGAQRWTHPPFGGEVDDGCVWGRGALDMKGGVAMLVAAVLRAQAGGFEPAGDVILAIVCDEEAGGRHGARFLVEQHPELFRDVRFAIGEFGGFTTRFGGRKFRPIQVAEKQFCHVRARVRGSGGHGSLPVRGGAAAQLGRLLGRLDRGRLPVHLTAPTRLMLSAMAAALPVASGLVVRQLLHEPRAGVALRALGPRGRIFEPVLRNTVNPTIVAGGEKINVVPSEITVDLDARVLPGLGAAELVAELGRLAGPDVDLEVVRHEEFRQVLDMGLFDLLAGILRETDPAGVPLPILLPGTTDARWFARLGIQTYGFLPLDLPAGFDFNRIIHGPDERVPVAAIEGGTDALALLIQRYGR